MSSTALVTTFATKWHLAHFFSCLPQKYFLYVVGCGEPRAYDPAPAAADGAADEEVLELHALAHVQAVLQVLQEPPRDALAASNAQIVPFPNTIFPPVNLCAAEIDST